MSKKKLNSQDITNIILTSYNWVLVILLIFITRYYYLRTGIIEIIFAGVLGVSLCSFFAIMMTIKTKEYIKYD